jgi:hypothetical protein
LKNPNEVGKKSLKLDIDILYSWPVHKIKNTLQIEEKMQIANSYLRVFNSFVFNRGKFIKLPSNEKGSFYMKDAYVFLCVYYGSPETISKLINHSIEESDLPDVEYEENNQDSAMECIVYFCHSVETSKVALSSFKLTTQNEMEALVKQLYNCNLRVELVEYGKEPFSLLAHLENNYVLSLGSRTDKLVSGTTKLYQIRSDFRYATTRAIQVPLESHYVTSLDLYFALNLDSEQHVLWKGESVKSYALDTSFELIQTIIESHKFASDIIDKIDDEDIELLVPEYGIPSLPENVSFVEDIAKLKEYTGREYEYKYIPAIRPNFFDCNFRTGSFQVERKLHYVQSDLKPDSCFLIDLGPPDKVYVWFGSKSSLEQRKLTNYCVDIWLLTCDDGRISKNQNINKLMLLEKMKRPLEDINQQYLENIITIDEGREPSSFKGLFIGWKDRLFDVYEPGNTFSRQQNTTSPMLFKT